MANLDLKAPTVVTAGTPFAATVVVTGGQPGAHVDVVLSQVRGLKPFFKAGATALLVPSGDANVVFPAVTLDGPTRAVLLASASDALGTFYSPDAEGVEVL